MEKIQEKLETLLNRFDSLSKDVEHLKEKQQENTYLRGYRSRSRSASEGRRSCSRSASVRDQTSTPASGRATPAASEGLIHHGPPRKRSWEDRMMDNPDERPDYDESIHWPEDDESTLVRTVEVSRKTEEFLEECCTKDIYNTRSQLRNQFGGLPRVPSSRTPRLDNFLKSEISSNCKTTDKELVRIQHHMLDALAPLSAIIEAEELRSRTSLCHALRCQSYLPAGGKCQL